MRIAIIGTRTPDAKQEELAHNLAYMALTEGEWQVATGAAAGIDSVTMRAAQQAGRTDLLYLFLPWPGYNRLLIPDGARTTVYDYQKEWSQSVYKYHPAPQNLTKASFKLHARNYGIVAGSNVVAAFPSKKLGGTGQGIRIAEELDIPWYVIPPEAKTLPEELLSTIRKLNQKI